MQERRCGSPDPAAATGVDGSKTNFPGFAGVPFLTIKDGSRIPIFNSVSADSNHDCKMDVATVKLDETINAILNPGTFWVSRISLQLF